MYKNVLGCEYDFLFLLCCCHVDMIARTGLGNKDHRRLSKKIKEVSVSLCDALEGRNTQDHQLLDFHLRKRNKVLSFLACCYFVFLLFAAKINSN